MCNQLHECSDLRLVHEDFSINNEDQRPQASPALPSCQWAETGFVERCSGAPVMFCSRLVDSALIVCLEPPSIGRLQAAPPETRVNSGLASRCSGNARFTRGSGQVLWRDVAGVVVGLRPPAAAIQPAMRPSSAVGWRGSALLVFYCGLLNCCLRVSDVMLRPVDRQRAGGAGFSDANVLLSFAILPRHPIKDQADSQRTNKRIRGEKPGKNV